MQNAADTAALAGAKEMRLGTINSLTLTAVAKRRALAALGPDAHDASVQVVVFDATRLQVQIDASSTSLFGKLAPAALSHLHAQATALTASTPTCLISLGTKGKALELETAAINANGCATYSDSQDNNGYSLKKASLQSAQNCSAGGSHLDQSVAEPIPINDCPVISDPLAARAPPPVGACINDPSYAGVGSKPVPITVSGGVVTLQPGNYCGGLTITNGATVTLAPGVFVMSNGPLAVDKSSSIQGEKVGVYFTGDHAALELDLQSSVNLIAPADGPMAGILFFEDRSNKPGTNHTLGSSNAPQLLGTIYFPQGNLTIGAPLAGALQSQLKLDIQTCTKLNLAYPCSPTSRIGQYSAWTIIIASQVTVNFVENLQLNTNYSANSTVPPAEISFKGAQLAQ